MGYISSLIVLYLFIIGYFPSAIAQTSIAKMEYSYKLTTSLHDSNDSLTEKFRPFHSHNASLHLHHHLKAVHGILNIIGWGILLPVGVIVARYYEDFPMQCSDEWFILHISCQISGAFVGFIGWVFGMFIRNSSKHKSLNTHGVLGTIIFSLASFQVLATCLKPKEENKCHKCWKICHHMLRYILVSLIIANIFQGIRNQITPSTWMWSYIVILGILGSIALALEILKWSKFFPRRPIINVS